eukprot:5856853-Amphidinium_carterae.1
MSVRDCGLGSNVEPYPSLERVLYTDLLAIRGFALSLPLRQSHRGRCMHRVVTHCEVLLRTYPILEAVNYPCISASLVFSIYSDAAIVGLDLLSIQSLLDQFAFRFTQMETAVVLRRSPVLPQA